MVTLTGQWRGTILGSNSGGLLLDIWEEDGSVQGIVEVRDDRFGFSTFDVSGHRGEGAFDLRLIPRDTQPGTIITPGTVRGRFENDNKIVGVWETEVGTAGTFVAERLTPVSPSSHDKSSMSKPDTKRPGLTPLWVISLFLSLTETVTAIAITQATGNVQAALTTFVIVFPLLVAAAFFAILWNRPYVFYPPTEFGGTTTVADYVRAFGGFPSIDSGAKQRWLIKETTEKTDRPPDSGGGTPSMSAQESARDLKLEHAVLKYFAFQQMRYTDVSNQESRAIFNLGVDHGFNLFDGLSGIVFFGYFYNISAAEIVARVRFLLANIQTSYVRVGRHQDPLQRQAAIQILDQLSATVLIPEDADSDQIGRKIEDFRPEGSKVPVKIVRPSQIWKFVKSEYEKMGLGSPPDHIE
jgi:hypothetical protein